MSGFAQDYVDVAERKRLFFEKYPEGSLRGNYELLTVGDDWFIAYRAECFRHPVDDAPGIGTAWEPVPGKTNFTKGSELQNAETSAWGRAIVAIGAADSKHIASADEVRNRDADNGTTSSGADDECSECHLRRGLHKPNCSHKSAASDEAPHAGRLQPSGETDADQSSVSPPSHDEHVPPSVRDNLETRRLALMAARKPINAQAELAGLPKIKNANKAELAVWAGLIEPLEIELAEQRAPFIEPSRS